ncbi:MAG: glycosyltransferase family 4 protein [Candidatus Latescibacterota bacterium]
MHFLFLTHYFPPEVNAPASRTFENARRWVKAGHRVTVLTCVPNHPNGVVQQGFSNRHLWQWDELEGVRILRVWTFISPNKGIFKRIINYLSYFISAVLLCNLIRKVDLVISTSPQFFCGLAGFPVSRLKSCPWIVEIRDLWPESISAVGAIRQKGTLNMLVRMESFMYQRPDHVVPVTHSFKQHIMACNVPEQNITVITNGADLDKYAPQPKDNPTRARLGLQGKFVVSYIGTHGMAHSLETLLQAAQITAADSSVVYLLVGSGAERDNLLNIKEKLQLTNVIMLPQQPKETIAEFIAASDVCLVLLRDTELFKTVIPSKMFEAMAMQRPIILGVRGESQIIVEDGQFGLCIAPENARELAQAVMRLKADVALCETLGRNGRALVVQSYSRDVLAKVYQGILERTASRRIDTQAKANTFHKK